MLRLATVLCAVADDTCASERAAEGYCNMSMNLVFAGLRNCLAPLGKVFAFGTLGPAMLSKMRCSRYVLQT